MRFGFIHESGQLAVGLLQAVSYNSNMSPCFECFDSEHVTNVPSILFFIVFNLQKATKYKK